MSARRALALRSIHLRIVPRPANLSESREIFRVLQGFGEISTYQSLRVRLPRTPWLLLLSDHSCQS